MRSFAGIVNSNYVGDIQALPTNINNTKFGQQPALPPSCVALTFNWAADYGASTTNSNIAVPVNIGGGGTTRQKLDNVRSVRIDNLGNPVPVYVNFPDTNYTVVAPPNSVVRENVETGQFSAFIYAEGFTTGQAGSTAVYFYNYPSSPFLDAEIEQAQTLYKASASISRGLTIYNQNFGVPALGDQTTQAILDVTSAGNTIGLMSTPLASGFIIITHIYLNLMSVGDNVVGFITPSLFFESTGISGVLYRWKFVSNLITDPGYRPDYVPIYQLQGGQLKLDATQTWRLRNDIACGGSVGFANIIINYTTSPN